MKRVVSLWLPRFATDRQRLVRQRRGGLAQTLLPWRRSAPAEPSFAALPGGSAGAKRDGRLHPNHGGPFCHPRAVAPFGDLKPSLARNARGAGEDSPFVTIREDGGRCLLAAVDAAAAGEGLGPGMALADARALLPRLVTAPADPAGDAAALDRLADWCGRYTPLVAIDGADEGGGAGLWLDVSGCAHLFGGEAALLADLVGRLEAFGYAARAGLAATPGMAWAAARFLAAAQGIPGAIVAPGAERAALKPLPPAALRLPPALIESLAQVGLRRVGEVLALPRAALARRFGAGLLQRLDQALGRAEEPVSPRQPAPPQRVRLAFPEPIAAADDLAAGLQRLLGALCRGLAVADAGARRLELALYRVDGSVQRTGIGTSRPVRDPQALARLFAPHLERLDPGFGVEVMMLAAPVSEPLSALQLVLGQAPLTPTLSPQTRGEGDDSEPVDESPPLLAPHPEEPPPGGVAKGRGEGSPPVKPGGRGGAGEALAELIDSLGNRLGLDAIHRCVPRQSHCPERSVEAVPPLAAVDAPARWPVSAPRPVRLLRAPEPVDVLSPFALLQAPDCAGPAAPRPGDGRDLSELSSPGLTRRSRTGPGAEGSGLRPSWMPPPSAGMTGEGRSVVRMAAPPGTIEVFDAPLLEEGAAPAAFRWRGRIHRIARADGPERIAPEWWRPDSPDEARDYYRAEDADGRRFWLYRTVPPAEHPSAACSAPEGAGMVTLTRKGSDRDGAPAAPLYEDLPLPFRAGLGEGDSMPRWYLHGLFA